MSGVRPWVRDDQGRDDCDSTAIGLVAVAAPLCRAVLRRAR